MNNRRCYICNVSNCKEKSEKKLSGFNGIESRDLFVPGSTL